MHGLCECEQIVANEYLTTENYKGVAQVRVSVISTNHIAPHFAQTSYSAVISENSSRGTAVANVTVRLLFIILVIIINLLNNWIGQEASVTSDPVQLSLVIPPWVGENE